MATRLLIVNNDAELAHPSKVAGEGTLRVERQGEALDALAHVPRGASDAVILDVLLPDISGFEVLKEICNAWSMPAIQPGDDVDQIVGLMRGTADSVPTPANQLGIRIRTFLRRMEARLPESGRPRLADDVSVDPASRTVRRGGLRIDVTAVEFDILRWLLDSAGQTVARETIVENVLGRPFSPLDRSVDMHICRLRRKLGPRTDGDERIKTVRGAGYIYTLPTQSGRSGAHERTLGPP